MQDQAIVALLDGIRWLQAPPAWPDDATRSWLTERGSMTRRLEKHCGHIRVRRFREGFVPACIEAGEAALLPDCGRFWLREVVLYGHDRPWLTARTLVPAATEAGPAQQVLSLGDVPLGQWLFRHRPPARDVIQFGRVGTLWARRARLRLPEGQPLLLTEAFLPDCPLYASGDDVPEK
ncbi:chorismate lyase [Candidatus Sodalis sp. SoCistrobi]|uniref:chorismate lyase n=1 Tax=Candidatus Sodalis sp. SoCistrobi TaxID=1922216 RepID=UPI000938BDA4|nr:chorismate lyase [Candidatus Sodalis sp. SoCistrobi]